MQSCRFASTFPKPISTRVRLLNLAAVILPFLGFVAVVVSLWGLGLPLGRLAACCWGCMC